MGLADKLHEERDEMLALFFFLFDPVSVVMPSYFWGAGPVSLL